MKKILFVLCGVTLLFSSCAFHSGIASNTTEVVLAKKNFKVVETVQGSSQAVYIIGFGGLAKNAMVAEARADMMKKANIVGGAKALANEVIDIKFSEFGIARAYKVTVTAHIVEFTE